MTFPIASKTRQEIRQSIGYKLGCVLVSSATATGTQTTLIDTRGLVYGGTDDYKGREIIMTSGTTNNIGQIARVTAFDATTKELTLSPALPSATAANDEYELYENYLLAQLNNAINDAVISASDDILRDKEDHSLIKEKDIYEYEIPSGFVALHTIEYEYDVKIDHQIHSCDDVWDELVDGDVTASIDDDNQKEGSACLKLVVAAGCGAGDILATDDISSLDITDCDEVTFWIYSTVALSAGDLQILLDNTASCASPVESLDIPAVSPYNWTKVTISLANPTSDSTIISVGLKMIVDKGAFTLRVDDIRAQYSNSRIYRFLIPDFWGIVQASTNLIRLSESGYAAIDNNKRLRLSGYQIPSELSSDSSNCDIDPDYVVAEAVANLLMSKARGRDVDIDENYRRATYWRGIAEARKKQGRTPLAMNTRWVS